jgi:hypothetical protein
MDLISNEIEIVPGVVGPREIVDDRLTDPPIDEDIGYRLRIEFDETLWRYVVRELTVVGFGAEITGERLRSTRVAEFLRLILTEPTPEPYVRELPNPDGREPWGFEPPEDVKDAPTRRAKAWVRHIYRYALAMGLPPTKTVATVIGLKPATAGRWVAAAIPGAEQGKVREV